MPVDVRRQLGHQAALEAPSALRAADAARAALDDMPAGPDRNPIVLDPTAHVTPAREILTRASSASAPDTPHSRTVSADGAALDVHRVVGQTTQSR